jgi:two-component system, NtrC family, C4-dicarboxylate transport sensor histidine kinase DctB
MSGRPRSFRLGIGGRLTAAFLAVASFAVGACVVGWLSYARLSRELAAIAEAHLPALAFSARLAEAGAKVIAGTPDLALAEGRESYERIRIALGERLKALGTVLAERRDQPLSPELLAVTEAIAANLSAIDRIAERRFPLTLRTSTIAEELRWLQADLVEEIEPLVEDARFNVEAALSRRAAGAPDANVIREESRRSEALLTVSAQAHLVIGLLGRLATVITNADRDQAANFLAESVDQLDIGTNALSSTADSVTMRQIITRVMALSDATSGLPAIKRLELESVNEGQSLLRENRRLVTHLGILISQEVIRTEAIARQAANRSAEAIRIGRNMLGVIAAASLIAAVSVGSLYVHRNLVGRLQTLTLAATTIAGGGTVPRLPAVTNDELGDLSRALAVFRQTRDELIQAAKLAALGQMTAGLSHELNQPLAAIRSHAHNSALLLDRGRADDARENLDRIQALTTRMTELIKHLKRFSRQPAVALGIIDLRQVVESTLALFDQQLKKDAIRVEVALPPRQLLVHAEEIRLEQVLVNLVSNAIDAVRGCDLRLIRIEAEHRGGRVVLRISDTGPGIPSELVSRIFDPFFTTKPIGRGLGLGLSISYNIVKDFGGSLTMHHSSPEGTAFALELAETG